MSELEIAFVVVDYILNVDNDISQFRYETTVNGKKYAKFIRFDNNMVAEVYGASDKSLSVAIMRAAVKVPEETE